MYDTFTRLYDIISVLVTYSLCFVDYFVCA